MQTRFLNNCTHTPTFQFWNQKYKQGELRLLIKQSVEGNSSAIAEPASLCFYLHLECFFIVAVVVDWRGERIDTKSR